MYCVGVLFMENAIAGILCNKNPCLQLINIGGVWYFF